LKAWSRLPWVGPLLVGAPVTLATLVVFFYVAFTGGLTSG